jgi:hypothetical protein
MRKNYFLKGAFLLLMLIGLCNTAIGQTKLTGPSGTLLGTATTLATSEFTAGFKSDFAIDGDAGSRWASIHFATPAEVTTQYLVVDLKAQYSIGTVKITWEGASASQYNVWGSTDSSAWTQIDVTQNGTGGRTDVITGDGTNYQYVRIECITADFGGAYGFSIFNIEIFSFVAPVLTTVTVSPANSAILPGNSINYTAATFDQIGAPFVSANPTTWSVTGAGCSIVEATGVLSTTAAGNCTVTATNTGITGSTNVTVYTPVLTTLTITPANASITAGNTQQFTVTGKDQEGANMAITSQSWTVSGAECSIDNTGLLTTTVSASGYFYATVNANSVNGSLSKDIYFSVGNYAKGKTVTTSSAIGAPAVDGDTGSRWESAWADPQWLVIDLSGPVNIGAMRISWEGANAKDYNISFSNTNDGTDWADTIYKAGMAEGARADIIGGLDLNYRYIKMTGTARNLAYGYSIFEFEVYGISAPFLSSITISPSTATILAGQTQSFTAQGLDQVGNPFTLTNTTTWSVTGNGCSIDADGLLSTTTPSTCVVTATNSTLTKTATVDVLPSDENVAIGKNAAASSGNASEAFDNNNGTRWESASTDPQWITVDLGVIQKITAIRIVWEGASSKDYIIEGSNDSSNWTTFVDTINRPAGPRTDAIYDLSGCNYRYVRLTGTARNTGYGHSIWEFKIYAAAKQLPVITWANPADITYGTAISATQLNATASVAGSFTYSVAIDSVLNSGNTQALIASFTPTDELNYSSTSDTVYINVLMANPVITWSNPADIDMGTALSATQLNATANVAGTFDYSPAIDSVLLVGNNQPLYVVFTPADVLNYNLAYDTVYINILDTTKSNPVITWDTPADITYGTLLSSTQLNATADVPGTFAYTPAIDAELNAGNAQVLSVLFTPTDAENYNTATKTVHINVLKANSVITWSNPADITYGTLLSGAELNATASVAGTFTYTPALSAQLNAGNAQNLTVIFTPTNAANYNAANDTVLINVNKATPVITWSNPADIEYGTALGATQFNATANVAGAFVYTPTSGTILNVGNAQALAVEFNPTDDANYNTTSTSVEINVVKANPVITWENPEDITYGTAISATQLNATASVAGTFEYSVEIDSVFNVGNAQSISVTFTPTDAANYNTASKSVLINVLTIDPVITWANPADITYGTAISATQLNATANVAGTFEYSVEIDSVMNAGNAQNISAVFTPTDENYTTITSTVQINVLKAATTVTWGNPADITYGILLSATQLNATASVPGSFAYTPAIGVKLNAGNAQSLSVVFTPTSTNYAAASESVTINVGKATPVITWENPANITEGAALSATQLNATANIEGTFAYTPAIGTVLSVGDNQNLNVEFTPADTANYNIASKTVIINISEGTAISDAENTTIEVFPNPCADVLTISNAANYSNVYVYNILGKQVLTSAITSNKMELQLGNYANGVYIIVLKGKDNSFTKRIIKN